MITMFLLMELQREEPKKAVNTLLKKNATQL